MENNNKDKPVRVRIKDRQNKGLWYRNLGGDEFDVIDDIDPSWYVTVLDDRLIYKSDCEVISPQLEKVNEGEKAEPWESMADAVNEFINSHPSKPEAWATDEDIKQAMQYSFGYASASSLIKLDTVINNYLQSIKNNQP